MRYLEAYEIIRTALKKSDLEFPLTGNFLSNFFDRHVNDIGLRVVRDKRSFTVSVSGTSYLIGEDDFTDRVFKVETNQGSDKVLVPFIPDASIHTGITTTEVDNIGYYVSHLTSKSGAITGATSASPCVITSNAHGLSVNDYVIISEMTGTDKNGVTHQLNGKRHKITAKDDNTFTLETDTSGMTAYSTDGGVWVQDSYQLNFTKSPEGTTTVYYYAKPRTKTSDKSMIDLPDSLLSAPIYRCLAEFLNLTGNLQVGSGYVGMAEKLEKDYLQLMSTKKSKQYILRQPLQEFIK